MKRAQCNVCCGPFQKIAIFDRTCRECLRNQAVTRRAGRKIDCIMRHNSLCVDCGKLMRGVSKQQKRCQPCASEQRKINGKNRDKTKVKIKSAISRARKYYDGPYDDIDPVFVLQRDNFMCGICGEKIYPRHKWPHPLSPSIDHIVPLSRGGLHSFDNVQASHKTCNLRKGNRPLPKGKLLLLGKPLIHPRG